MTKILIYLSWFISRDNKVGVLEPVVFSVVIFGSVKGGVMVLNGNDVNRATKCCHV